MVENEPCERVVWEGRGPVGSHARVIYEFGDASNGDGTDFPYMNEYDLPGGPLGRMAGPRRRASHPKRAGRNLAETQAHYRVTVTGYFR